MLYWSHTSATPSLQTGAETLRHQAVQAELMRRQFGSERMLAQLGSALQGALHGFLHQQQLELGAWLDDATETLYRAGGTGRRLSAGRAGCPGGSDRAPCLGAQPGRCGAGCAIAAASGAARDRPAMARRNAELARAGSWPPNGCTAIAASKRRT
ncbi:hypothetical protein LP420_38965 [Massilia sp. B-10]|nr:hypothetical protein LP420_38965 [Massilia sp. B-10]